VDDEGKYHYGKEVVNTGVTFNTQGFPESSLRVLAEGLTEKFGFPFEIGYNKKTSYYCAFTIH